MNHLTGRRAARATDMTVAPLAPPLGHATRQWNVCSSCRAWDPPRSSASAKRIRLTLAAMKAGIPRERTRVGAEAGVKLDSAGFGVFPVRSP